MTLGKSNCWDCPKFSVCQILSDSRVSNPMCILLLYIYREYNRILKNRISINICLYMTFLIWHLLSQGMWSDIILLLQMLNIWLSSPWALDGAIFFLKEVENYSGNWSKYFSKIVLCRMLLIWKSSRAFIKPSEHLLMVIFTISPALLWTFNVLLQEP